MSFDQEVKMPGKDQPSNDQLKPLIDETASHLHEKNSAGFLMMKRTGASGDNIPSYEGRQEDENEEDVKVTKWKLNEPFVAKKPQAAKRLLEDEELHHVLEMPSIIPLRSAYFDKDNLTAANFIGEFRIENKTDQYYGFKILCNKSAFGTYEASPNMKCIPPFEGVTVRVEVKQENLTHYIAKGDTLIVRGHRLGGPVNRAKLQKFMNRMAVVWPNVGEKFVLRPLLLESGTHEISDALEISEERLKLDRKFAKMMQRTRLPNRRFGFAVNKLNHQLHSSQLHIRSIQNGLRSLQFQISLVLYSLFVIGIFWTILPLYYTHVKPVIMMEPGLEGENGFSTILFLSIRSICAFIFGV